MLIAQALGEYGAMAAVAQMASDGTARLEDTIGNWGTEGIAIAIGVLVLWKVLSALR